MLLQINESKAALKWDDSFNACLEYNATTAAANYAAALAAFVKEQDICTAVSFAVLFLAFGTYIMFYSWCEYKVWRSRVSDIRSVTSTTKLIWHLET